MCFTVAIVRNNTLLTTEKYYESLEEDFIKKTSLPEFPDYYFVSGFSHPELPVMTENRIFMSQWGLVPSWIKSERDASEIRTKTLNAMGETILEKPSFRKSAQYQRCLLPVTGFYEYRDVNGVKYPYYIYGESGSGLLLGALYDTWINPTTGEALNTFSIVTTVANSLMETIHNLKKRMPLILDTNEAYKWVDKRLNTEELKTMIKPFESSKMEAHTISKIANNARMNRNVPEIMNRVSYPELEGFIQNTLF